MQIYIFRMTKRVTYFILNKQKQIKKFTFKKRKHISIFNEQLKLNSSSKTMSINLFPSFIIN